MDVKKYLCHSCGHEYSDEMMADWTICRACMQEQMELINDEPVFIDQLGIAWTESELKEAGGMDEVKRMAREADVRTNANC